MALSETQLLHALTDAFRRHGYEGASLNILSAATGLARASLYHRFPRGKAQMAEVVMRGARNWLDQEALAPLRDDSLTPAARIRAMSRHLDAFYDAGRKSCLLDALSIGETGGTLRQLTRGALDLWIRRLAEVGVAAGLDEHEASARAERALILLQGALVVSRIRKDPTAFRRVLEEMPEQLLGA